MTVSRKFVWLAAVALWAIPTLASAHAGNDGPNVVHACIGNVSKVVRIVGASGVCIAAPPLIAETPAHWDIQGPPGKDGTNGTNGTNGSNGIDGTSVTFVGNVEPPAGGCANGGALYATGNPPVYNYVCNGINGIDGEDGAPATRADGPCFDNSNRYVDCGNGTVTDTVTGLIWLKQWNCLPNNTWAAANQAAVGLKNGDCGLTDNSSAGDWRLPTRDEWTATIAQAVAMGCRFRELGLPGGLPPSLTNDAGTACYNIGPSSFAGVAGDFYWSSASLEAAPDTAWLANFLDGQINQGGKAFTLRVWPVRGGRR